MKLQFLLVSMLGHALNPGQPTLTDRILNGERDLPLTLYASAVTPDVKEQLELCRLARLIVAYEPKNHVLTNANPQAA